MNISRFNSDCFDVFPLIKEKSIDLVIVDLPYGQTACKWDSVINLEQMWKELKRCCTKKCVYVFFCTTKFGVSIINSNPKWFRYDLVWSKSKKVGFLSANKMPLRKHEMIYVFGETGYKFKQTYTPQKIERDKIYIDNRKILKKSPHYREEEMKRTKNKYTHRHPDSILEYEEPEHEMIYVFGSNTPHKTYNPQKVEGTPYKASTRKQNNYYRATDDKYAIKVNENKGTRHPTSILKYEEAEKVKIRGGKYNDSPYGDFKNTKTIDDGTRHPTTVLEYKNPSKPVHRTQKPVDLLEWLIKSYSNKGDTVLDFTAGSGSTGVACMNTERKCILIEMDSDIFNILEKRISENLKN